jgi:hypothetical protein
MGPKASAAAAAAVANALFIFYLQNPLTAKTARQVKPYPHSQVVIRLFGDFFLNARTALLILPSSASRSPAEISIERQARMCESVQRCAATYLGTDNKRQRPGD